MGISRHSLMKFPEQALRWLIQIDTKSQAPVMMDRETSRSSVTFIVRVSLKLWGDLKVPNMKQSCLSTRRVQTLEEMLRQPKVSGLSLTRR